MRKLMFVFFAGFMLFGGVALWMNVYTQVPTKVQIAFVSDRDGNPEIYVMNADGTNLRRLTNHPAGDWDPAWSPDGKSIAFKSSRDKNWEVYVMDANGKHPHNLTNHPSQDSRPDWFNPAFAYSVSLAGKLRRLWGWLKTAR